MGDMTESNQRHWYVLSVKEGIRGIERHFEQLSAARMRRGEEPVEYFMPTCVRMSSSFGQARMSRRKLIGNYIFVHDSYKNILEAKQVMQSLWLLPDPDRREGQRAFMTISDHDMALFKAIAKAYSNQLPCLPIDAVDLEEGDKVEIVGGEFDGMCGTLHCSQGRTGGKVLMAIGNIFIAVTPDIRPQFICILQFGKGNRHPYRLFEAHVPRVLQALNHLHGNKEDGISAHSLTTDDVAAMTVFTGRFESLRPSTVNIASQHATLMFMSYAALQDTVKTDQWRQRCQLLIPKIKSDTQRAWQLALMFAATGDEQLHRQASDIVSTWTIAPSDRKRTLITTTLHNFRTVFLNRE